MASRRPPAREAARWLSPNTVHLDDCQLAPADADWLSAARRIRAGNVRAPAGFFAELPDLQWLEFIGGSRTDCSFVTGCRSLRFLYVAHVRGLVDLSAVVELAGLEFLQLYALPQVSEIPSAASMTRLRRAELGSMKGLTGLTGLLEAPVLEELVLLRRIGLAPDDADAIADHSSIRTFDWYAEDVPNKTWVPFVERVAKPKARLLDPEVWFREMGIELGWRER